MLGALERPIEYVFSETYTKDAAKNGEVMAVHPLSRMTPSWYPGFLGSVQCLELPRSTI